MKKAKARSRGSAGKTSRSAARSVDEYMAGVPERARNSTEQMRATIRSAVPADATETISYRMPAFRHDDHVLVWFAAFANHCSLFPTASVIEAFQNDLKGYQVSKGTIQFPLDKPLPVALIKRIVKARVEQLTAKKRR